MNWLLLGFLAGTALLALPVVLHFLRSKPKSAFRFPTLHADKTVDNVTNRNYRLLMVQNLRTSSISWILCGLIFSLFVFSTHAAIESEDCTQHFYGSKSRPQIEFEYEESEGSRPLLTLSIFEAHSLGLRAASQFPKPANSRKIRTGIEISGTIRLQGREVLYRAKLTSDRRTLELLEPKSVLLTDGTTLELAGQYAGLSEENRAASEKAILEAADNELNAVYSMLFATLKSAEQDELRIEQRRWLKYRDFVIYDGDNADIIGPGSAPHFRQQGVRTRERIDFLNSLSISTPPAETGRTLFSDGCGGTFAVERQSEAVLFSASISYPNLKSPTSAHDIPCVISGSAQPSGKNRWVALTENIAATDSSWTLEQLLLVFDENGRLKVEPAGEQPGSLARAIAGRYHPQRPLMPSEEPLRALLMQLPEAAFDETTEGLTTLELEQLGLTGTGGTFKIETQQPDALLLRHHDGTVKLRRFAGAEGGVVVAVEQTNGRNNLLQLWQKPRVGASFALWADAIAKLPVQSFFDDDLGPSVADVHGNSTQVIRLMEPQTLELVLNVSLETPQPDYHFALEWDGYTFALERLND